MAEQGSGLAASRVGVKEVGLFASESLFVSFDFTRDEMLAAGARYMETLRAGKLVEMPSEIKTYVHELTHYVQCTTTPYGLFLQYCRVMQSRATMIIVHTLLEAGIPFKIPLLQNVPVLTGDTATTVNLRSALFMPSRDGRLLWFRWWHSRNSSGSCHAI